MSVSSPTLIKDRWIICGLLCYLAHSLGRKIYCFWFSAWHQDTYTSTSEAQFKSTLSCVSCPLDLVQAQDFPHITTSQLLPEASLMLVQLREMWLHEIQFCISDLWSDICTYTFLLGLSSHHRDDYMQSSFFLFVLLFWCCFFFPKYIYMSKFRSYFEGLA